MYSDLLIYSLMLDLASRCFTPTLENGWVEAEENMAANTFVGRFRYQFKKYLYSQFND